MALTRTRELRGDGSSRASLRALQACFGRNGYVRVFDPARRNVESSQAYKKGYEVRLIVADARKLTELRRALEAAGFRPGRPFKKGHRIAQPVYGRAAVEAFRRILRISLHSVHSFRSKPVGDGCDALRAAGS